jgi:hypothetical protein
VTVDDYTKLMSSLKGMSRDDLVTSFIRIKEEKDRLQTENLRLKESARNLSAQSKQVESLNVSQEDMSGYAQRYNSYMRGK